MLQWAVVFAEVLRGALTPSRLIHVSGEIGGALNTAALAALAPSPQVRPRTTPAAPCGREDTCTNKPP